MPRHVVVSPEEDLASFYGSADPLTTTGASAGSVEPPLPVAPAVAAAPAPQPVQHVAVYEPLAQVYVQHAQRETDHGWHLGDAG